MTATPTATTEAEWRRYDACHICDVAKGVPCRNRLPGSEGQTRHRPHPERLHAAERDKAGGLILGRREHVTSSNPGTTHGAYAHHAILDGTAVCSGALIDEATRQPLDRLTIRQRCQRPSCKRLWRSEAWR